MEDVRIQAIIAALVNQRNQLSDQVVELWGEIALLRKQVNELQQKEIEENKDDKSKKSNE